MFTRDERVDPQLDQQVQDLLSTADSDGILPIVQMGEPVLRQKSIRYQGQLKSTTLQALIELMRTTMLEAPGVGLAAPQIGLGLAIAVLEDRADEDSADDPRQLTDLPFRAIINPSYQPIGQNTASFYEGCLSFSGYQAVRQRWLHVQASWEDECGQQHQEELNGWPARIFQHETDHLQGEVYIDQAIVRSLSSDDNLSQYWAYDPVPTQAAQELGFQLPED